MTDVIAADRLRLLIERIERLEEEKAALASDIRDVYAEAKSDGFDTKTMRACVRLRKMEKHAREEAEMMLDTYKAALGLDYSSTPLGAATIERQINSSDVVKLAADIHDVGGRIVGGSLVIPMDGLKDSAAERESLVTRAMRQTVDAVNGGALGPDVSATFHERTNREPAAATNEQALYDSAVKLVAEHCKASTSWLQRQLRVGYNSAARLVERMEREGLISKPDHVGARTVLPAAASAAVRLEMA
jgi:uncharacterized protein (UPF0335 family)